ncbi:MAG: TetR/AcrR family transcriptional regulator [Rickettsiales bacterium]
MRRVQLMEAAMITIAAHGLTQTTIAHVSAAAGMSRGIINFYFKSKESMLRETLAHLLQTEQEAVEAALQKSGDKPVREKLSLVTETLCSSKLYSKKRLGVWCAFAAHAASHAPTRYLFEQSHTLLLKQLTALCRESGMATPNLAAQHLLTLIQGLRFNIAMGANSLDVEQILASLHVDKIEAVKAERPKIIPMEKPMAKKQPKKKTLIEKEDPPVVADLFSAL